MGYDGTGAGIFSQDGSLPGYQSTGVEQHLSSNEPLTNQDHIIQNDFNTYEHQNIHTEYIEYIFKRRYLAHILLFEEMHHNAIVFLQALFRELTLLTALVGHVGWSKLGSLVVHVFGGRLHSTGFGFFRSLLRWLRGHSQTRLTTQEAEKQSRSWGLNSYVLILQSPMSLPMFVLLCYVILCLLCHVSYVHDYCTDSC